MAENHIVVDSPKNRVTAVRALVGPLRPLVRGHRKAVAAELVARENVREIVVAVKGEVTRGRSYRDWFFQTEADAILAQYFEEWSSDATESTWRLAQVCLHLFWVAGRHADLEEVLAVHCEPRELRDTFSAKLKRGPHVHLKRAGYPLDAAHFPLNYCHLDSVLESLTTLTEAMSAAVQVALAEVVQANWR